MHARSTTTRLLVTHGFLVTGPLINHLLPLPLVQIKSSMLACTNPKPWCFAAIHYDSSLFSAKQHNRHCVILGDELNPHPAMVEIILQPEMGVEKKVLDIGQSPSVIPKKKSH